jgi:putative transposase
VRLLPTPEQEELLWRVGDAVAKLINMENYRRRRLFFEGKGIDYNWKSAWKRRETDYIEIYKLLGSVNFHETCRFISEMWRSFVSTLKAKKKGRLEPWQIVHPPGYRKREGQRTPIILVRFDNYKVDLERKALRLKYWNVELRFSGKPKWLVKPGAEQGRLTITYDPVKKRWYAHVSVRVRLERERDSGLKAGIDLGREITAAAAVEDGHALLYRGSVMKSDYYYFEKRIAAIDRVLSDPKLEEMDRSVLKEEHRRLYDKMRRRREQIFANTAAHLARTLKTLNVSIVFIGYPRNIAHEKAGKGNTNSWSYRKLIARMAVTLENHGIALFAVPDNGTSRLCTRHGCRVVRKPRGLVKCEKGHTMHSDVNAALNILAKGAHLLRCEAEVPERLKVHSFTPTPNRVIERKRKKRKPHSPTLKAG